jgi:hypothetical protein
MDQGQGSTSSRSSNHSQEPVGQGMCNLYDNNKDQRRNMVIKHNMGAIRNDATLWTDQLYQLCGLGVENEEQDEKANEYQPWSEFE